MGFFKRQRKAISSRKVKNLHSDKFLSDISQINWKRLVDLSDNVSTAVNNLTNLLSTFIEEHAPLRTMFVSDKVTPWLTTESKKLARSRDKLKTAVVNTSHLSL